MKIKKYLFIIVSMLLCFNMNVFAESSKFEPFLTMPTDITENQVRVALGFAGEEIMTIKETLTYDSNKLTLVEVQALDNFNVTTSPEKKNGKYRTLEILADSDYSFNESNYAILVFEVKASFKKKNKSDIFLYDYTASGPDKIKYRSKGVISTLNRVSASEMNFVLDDITDSTKTKYWVLNHIYVFVIIGLIIVGAVVLIFLLPSKRKKEVREKSTEDLLKAENYDPNSSSIKIDREAIDAIGKVEKPIDMTQAIIVDENVKPFGDIVGKFDAPTNNGQVVDNNNATNVFTNPQQPVNKVAEAPLPQVTGEHIDNGTSVNGFDPFNATVMPTLKEDDGQNVSSGGYDQNEGIETLEEASKEVVQPNDGLTVINPQNFDNVEIPKLNEDVNIGFSSNENPVIPQNSASPVSQEQANVQNQVNPVNPMNTTDNNTGNNGTNILSILFALIFLSSFLSMNVRAEEENYQVAALRDVIVGRASFDKNLDYNNDGVIDVLDIVETKDLTNCSFENLLSTDPGFAEIHGKSNNLISSDSEFVAPTRKTRIFGGDKSTTKRTTKEKTTKDKTSGGGGSGSSSSGNRTTKERTTRSTAEKTTREITERTTKGQAQKYSVTLNATNGSVNPNTFELEVGKSKTVSLSANQGFVIDEASTSCSNISYSFSGTNRLILSNVTNNATCNLKFVSNGKVKVTLTYFIGKGKSDANTPTFTYSSKSINNGGNGVYNQTWSTGIPLPTGYKLKEAPTCGNYNAGTYSIVIPATSTTCKMYFDPILYDFKVSLSGQATQINGGTLARIFYGERKKIEFEANTVYSNVSCPGGTATRLSKTGRGPYHYSFSYTHNTASNAVCTIS